MKKLLYLFTIFALLFTTTPVGANNYATIFNPITGNRKVVKVGDPHAFDNGYLLEVANGYTKTTSDMLGYSVVSDYQTTLSSSMTSTQSTIAVSSMATTDGHTLTMSDLGSKVFLTIEPTSSSKKEIVMCTGISSSTWTGCTRGLAFYGTSTASVSANRKKHSAGSIIIISNVHYVYEQLVDKDTSETITGDKTYSGNVDFSVNLPTIPTATPTTSDQIASKQYVDDVGAGGFTSSNIGDGKTLRANGTSPETMDIATSTSEMASFDIENGYFVVSTTTGEKIDTHWNDRYNATTTKSGDFIFSDGLTIGNMQIKGNIKTLTAGETINGATLPVAVYQNTSDNKLYACDGDDVDKLKFIGFAISNGTDENNIDLQVSGIVNGFTGLLEGTSYYVQDDKTIGTNRGTYVIQVGIAISATELLIIQKDNSLFPSEKLQQSADTSRSVNATPNYLDSLAKKKDIQINKNGRIRVKFTLTDNTSNGTTYGWVYINDIKVGTERTTGTSDTFSEDFDVNVGDNIQGYVACGQGASDGDGAISNFRIYYGDEDPTIITD